MAHDSFAYDGREARRYRRYSLPGRSVLLLGLALLEGAFALALVLTLGLAGNGDVPHALGPFAVLAALLQGFLAFRAAGDALPRPTSRSLRIAEQGLIWMVVGAVMLTLPLPGLAPLAIVAWAMIAAMLLTGLRLLAYRRLGAMFALGRFQIERIGLVGAAEQVARFEREASVWQRGYQVVASLDAQADGAGTTAFFDHCVALGCQHVMIVGHHDETALLQRTAAAAQAYSLDVLYAPLAPASGMIDVLPIGPTGAVRIASQPLGELDRFAKRLFDIALGLLALVLLAPLLLIVAALIRLTSPGPAIYRQERRGFNGQPFMIYKFRSMTVTEDGRSMRPAEPGDRRITPLGHFIRRTSIDELPQLFNVLRGDMSLVGPRPHAVSHDDALTGAYARFAHRRRIKPGITGWAQVNGHRGDISGPGRIENRTALDLYYAENWSLAFDVWILLLTVFSTKTGQNAG